MMGVDEKLTRLLGGPDRSRLRQRLRRYYERTDGSGNVSTTLRLDGLSADEVSLLASLMGRQVRHGATTIAIDVADIDSALQRAGLARSLREALERLDGPIVGRAEALAAAARRWSGVVARPGEARLAAWLATPGGLGLLKRLARQDTDIAAELCDRAARVLDALPAAGIPRAALAARVLGDAHALDTGAPTATIVVAALRHADRIGNINDASDGEPGAEATDGGQRRGEAVWGNAEPERDRHVWARAGVLVNELARPALVLNLPLASGQVWGCCVGEPAYMSLRVLVRTPPSFGVAGKMISVCENANALAMVADRLGAAAAPLVCTDGMPAAAQRTLLSALAAAGAKLRYHGDFDWAGLRIASTVMDICGAAPWRFAGEHYQAAAARFAGAPLVGSSAPSPWDDHLAELMRTHRLAIAEEAMIDDLIEDLG